MKGKIMDTWYSKDLGDGVAAFGPTSRIQEAFMKLAMAGVYSHDLAVFSRYDFRRNVVTVYFTSSAKILAQAFGAVPCEKPMPEEGFALLVGDNRSWEVHFPGYLESRHVGEDSNIWVK
jgi:hypothetical protein